MSKVARTLSNFTRFMNPRFFAEREFFDSIIADTYDFLCQDEYDLLMINLPQSAGKSYFANLVAGWLIGIDNSLSILRINSTQSRANDFTRAVSTMMESQQYRSFFPLMPKTKIDNAKELWLAGNWNASYRGVGADVSTMSARANLLLVDDIYTSFKEAVNVSLNKKLETKWTTEWFGRLEGSRMKVISIGTRYARKDFYNYLETNMKLYKSIKIPALIDGRSFCEFVRSTERFEQLRAMTHPDLWNAIYQQEPSVDGQIMLFEGHEFLRADLKGFTFDKTFTVADPSFGVGSDYFVCGFFGIKNKTIYLLDLLIDNQASFEDYFNFIDKKRADYNYCEKNGVGSLVLRRAIKEKKSLMPFVAVGEKYARILDQQERIKSIVIADDCTALTPQLLQQITDYPDVENDDLPDMLASACNIAERLF